MDVQACRNNWSCQALDIFRSLNIEDSFWNKQCVDINNVTLLLKQQACNRWYDTIHKKPKLRTYVVLKTSYEPENYVKYCFNRKNRSLMAQIRLGILPINIQTGRYTNIPIKERLCNQCETIEHENHFVLNCRQYNVERELLFSKAVDIYPDFQHYNEQDKMCFLFNEMWKEMCIFIRDSWTIRQSNLYM
jgi:hypothetical protein